jgi:DNA-binding NarL/FixJ family response regulator
MVLSTREREILELLAEGLSNQQIANQLFIARSTVKNHIAAIFRKTGTKSRIEVVVKFYKGQLG